jgi:hypothetical protein
MNLAALIQGMFEGLWGERVFRATVTGTSGNLVTIQRTGQAAADPQSYAKLASYSSPQVADEVVVLRVGSGWIVMGKVIR